MPECPALQGASSCNEWSINGPAFSAHSGRSLLAWSIGNQASTGQLIQVKPSGMTILPLPAVMGLLPFQSSLLLGPGLYQCSHPHLSSQHIWDPMPRRATKAVSLRAGLGYNFLFWLITTSTFKKPLSRDLSSKMDTPGLPPLEQPSPSQHSRRA